ncbi:MAG TPA: DUF3617 domain-containing protein [Allosphingosinicella sp.]|jgi:hypothetical protein|nr:DUF3617 domain-containing protein [Allosphingosinicella sp.]
MKIHLILGVAALALASCGGSAGDGNQSGGNGSAAAAAGGGASGSAINLQPGEWEMKMEVVNVKVEGLPEGVAESMKKQGGEATRTCMTPEEAKGPKPDLFTKNNPANCKSEGFSWANGRIQGKTVCSGEGGAGKSEMTMDGRYSAQNIDMTMKSDTEMMGKTMTMEMRLSGRRVGECTAATKEG